MKSVGEVEPLFLFSSRKEEEEAGNSEKEDSFFVDFPFSFRIFHHYTTSPCILLHPLPPPLLPPLPEYSFPFLFCF
jgi:hypothetical protein